MIIRILFSIYSAFVIFFLSVSYIHTKRFFSKTIDGFIHHPSADKIIIYFHISMLLYSLVFFSLYLFQFDNHSVTLKSFLISVLIIGIITILNFLIYEALYKYLKKKLRNDGYITIADQDEENGIESSYIENILLKEYRSISRNFVGLLSIFYLFFFIFPTNVIDERVFTVKKNTFSSRGEHNIVNDAQHYYGDKWFTKLVEARRKYVKRHGLEKFNRFFGEKFKPIENEIAQYELKQQLIIIEAEKIEKEKEKILHLPYEKILDTGPYRR